MLSLHWERRENKTNKLGIFAPVLTTREPKDDRKGSSFLYPSCAWFLLFRFMRLSPCEVFTLRARGERTAATTRARPAKSSQLRGADQSLEVQGLRIEGGARNS